MRRREKGEMSGEVWWGDKGGEVGGKVELRTSNAMVTLKI